MKESDRIARNTQRLTELYPAFAARLARVIKRLEADGLRPRIQDAYRSPQDQRAAFDAGHSDLLYGFHNVTSKDGKPESLAAELLDDDAPTTKGIPYALRLAAAAEAEGLSTGIRWGLTPKQKAAIDAAIAKKDWMAKVVTGWDAYHVEPTGITVAQAKMGRRPE
jgi:hypothetical protein